jgi:hypothetical protein
MLVIGLLFVGVLRDWFSSRRRSQAEILLILRHQLNVLQSVRRITICACVGSTVSLPKTPSV